MSDLESLLSSLPRWTLVGGKGGVGKTTCAAALAERWAATGHDTLLLSTDPARSLADAIGCELGAEPRPVAGSPRLYAFQLEAAAAREAFLARWREILITIVDRGTYLDRAEIAGLIDAALPGADEAMALLTFVELEGQSRWSRIIVDTAPTGHTLRLLSLPDTFRALIELLDAMQGKHRFMVSALTHQYRADRADAFLADMRSQLEALRVTLTEGKHSAVLLVTRPEPVVVAETARYLAALEALRLTLGGLVINAIPAKPGPAQEHALMELGEVGRGLPCFHVPELEKPPMGLAGVKRWGEALRLGTVSKVKGTGSSRRSRHRKPAGTAAASRRVTSRSDVSTAESLAGAPGRRLQVRALTIVGGKGGVGKTTAACALAIATARPDAPVLVVSTDPAPSLADALEQRIEDAEVAVHGAPGLFARQMDSDAAFAALRDEYATRVDALFDELTGGTMDAAHDRRIVRELFAFAPPGIDELYALSLLGETLATARFARVIVDPAPTGHLLRLLEMPALALDWSHRLLRLLLEYKEIIGLGDTAGDLLSFARRVRTVAALLRDPVNAGILVVALDEPLVRSETGRLVALLRAHSVDVMGILWNRVSKVPEPLPVSPPVDQFESPACEPPPRGVDALRNWFLAWRPITDEHG